jgi:hypothetical protein
LCINSWAELEEKFHSHFYTGIQETRLSHLTSVKQMRDETVVEFFNRVRENKNKCFHLSISERDLVDICFNGFHSRIREKLENVQFTSFNHLIERAVFWESRLKESRDTYKTHRSNTHAFSTYSDGSDDENQECMAAEIRWPAKNKMVTCPSLKPIHKNRGEEMKFTFDFSKCDRIFDELLKFGYIRINYTLPSIDELKKSLLQIS